MTALAELRGLLRERAARLKEPLAPVIVRTAPLGDGSPHIEMTGETLSYVVQERGKELRRRDGLSPDEAAYHLLRAATLERALAEESATRRKGYSRWNWMAPHIAMARAMSPAWGKRLAGEYAEVLARHPLTAEERRWTHPRFGAPD